MLQKKNEETYYTAYDGCKLTIDNTCQLINSFSDYIEQEIQSYRQWSLPNFSKEWKENSHQTTAEMEHKERKNGYNLR